jgi:NADPH:quinone reductase-like Zn-dependent oxidoreductase
MKAIVLKDFGGVENLKLTEIPIPEISENEVLVRTKAISINPVDIKTRQGEALANNLKDYNPIILGWDICGIIEKIGKNVTDLQIGQEVFGMVNFVGHGKAYAEYVAVPAEHLALKPDNISHSEAAASTLAALTAWQAFNHFGKLKRNDKVLIHGASGGVGHFAVQIAKYMGSYVIGTSSSKNEQFVYSFGADQHIDYKNENFEQRLNNIDFVLETVGYGNFKRSVKVLRNNGTIVNLPSGLTEDDKKAAIAKNLKACYFMSVFSSGRDMEIIAKLLQENTISPYIFKSFKFDQIKEAHELLASGNVVGKIVIEID